MVTLIDGRQVESDSEDWRHECEARYVAAMPMRQQRLDYVAAIERRRGAAEAERLRMTVRMIWAQKSAV